MTWKFLLAFSKQKAIFISILMIIIKRIYAEIICITSVLSQTFWVDQFAKLYIF